MDKKENKPCYPFSAIVGQEEMKLALVLNLINPRLGGVLIRGEKGTAKSTAVRALASLLPDVKVVELPVSATEDRVVGTLDIEKALQTGEKHFEPGILAQADGNILYVDEVNLLDDHVVDVLLDCAAMGVNTVEREGISYSHSARFTLIGTMNPEEGDLRPQLLDRFGLVVDVAGEKDKEQRVEVIRRRLEFEKDPEKLAGRYRDSEKQLSADILAARSLLDKVSCEDSLLSLVAALSIELDVDGHRADISMIKTAMTLAASEGRDRVSDQDVARAAVLVLPHRMRRQPFERGVLDREAISGLIETLK